MPLDAASFVEGFEELELDAVIGCDSAARDCVPFAADALSVSVFEAAG